MPRVRPDGGELGLLRHVPVQVGEPLRLALVVPPVVDPVLEEVRVALRVPGEEGGDLGG